MTLHLVVFLLDLISWYFSFLCSLLLIATFLPDSGQTQALPPPPPAGDRHSATRSGTVQGHRVLPGQGRAATALPPGDRGSLAFLIWVMKGFQKLC